MGIETLIGLAATGYSIYQGEQAAGRQREAMDQAKAAQSKQDAENAKLKKEAQDRSTVEEANRQREAQKMRAQAASGGLRGRSATLLTGPAGLPTGSTLGGTTVPGSKTLLGA